MPTSRLFLFTNTFPYGKGETFIANEIPYLAKAFISIHIIPLYRESGQRQVPDNVIIEEPLIAFNPKKKIKLLLRGTFCLSPLFFAISLFFSEKAYKSTDRIWNFFTSLLVLRSSYRTLRISPTSTDILYFYWADNSTLLIPFLKKKYGNCCAVRFHRFDIFEYARNGYIPFRKWLFRDIDIAMPISNNGKQYLLDTYGKSAPQNIIVSRLGVFDNGLNPENSTDETFQIVSCSNIIPVKRVELLAKAIAKLNFPTTWTHIGEGQNRTAVETIIAQYPKHIQANLIGSKPNSEVNAIYRNQHFDLFINVSQSEGLPVSIMEATSFGIPVIATNVGGTNEIVDSSIGFLVDENISENELSSIICKFHCITNKSEYRLNARQKWASEFNADTNYQKLLNILINK